MACSAELKQKIYYNTDRIEKDSESGAKGAAYNVS